MTPGLDTNPFQIIRQLALSTRKFYLTGSRFFGHSLPSSDWDFFTESGDHVVHYLESKGFKRISMKPDWFDSICTGIYRNGQIEVALVDNVRLKRKAQLFIRDVEPRYLEMLKHDMMNKQDIWNEVYTKCAYIKLDLDTINMGWKE